MEGTTAIGAPGLQPIETSEPNIGLAVSTATGDFYDRRVEQAQSLPISITQKFCEIFEKFNKEVHYFFTEGGSKPKFEEVVPNNFKELQKTANAGFEAIEKQLKDATVGLNYKVVDSLAVYVLQSYVNADVAMQMAGRAAAAANKYPDNKELQQLNANARDAAFTANKKVALMLSTINDKEHFNIFSYATSCTEAAQKATEAAEKAEDIVLLIPYKLLENDRVKNGDESHTKSK
ncbi:MAG: hypothetical protein ACH346_02880 [Chthoniobacterales bacterium]